jgi:hypothetical protein
MGIVGMEYSFGKAWPMAEEADSCLVCRGKSRAPPPPLSRVCLPLTGMESLEEMEDVGETPRILDNSYQMSILFPLF